MRCPYNTTLLAVGITYYCIDDDGQIQQDSTITAEQHIWPDCLRDKCAAWRDGACCYSAPNI